MSSVSKPLFIFFADVRRGIRTLTAVGDPTNLAAVGCCHVTATSMVASRRVVSCLTMHVSLSDAATNENRQKNKPTISTPLSLDRLNYNSSYYNWFILYSSPPFSPAPYPDRRELTAIEDNTICWQCL